MRSYNFIGLFAAVIMSTQLQADPTSDSGLVSMVGGQIARLNVVNVANAANTCRLKLSFIYSDGTQYPPNIQPVITISGNESFTLTSLPAPGPTSLRAHIDFEPQFLNNPQLKDPLTGCYGLIPTLEIADGNKTAILNTQFYWKSGLGFGGKLEKTYICHKPGSKAAKTLEVAISAVNGHLNHGDTLGPCPED